MTKVEFLDRLNEFYPDAFLATYYDARGNLNKKGKGDTLALYIVSEAIDAWEEATTDCVINDEVVAEAADLLFNRLTHAKQDLESVQGALSGMFG